MRLDPLNGNIERESTGQMITVTNNYYYVSVAEIKMKEKEQLDQQMNSNNLLTTTAPNNSKKSIDDEQLDKLQFLDSAENLIDNQFTFFLKDQSNINILNQNQVKEMNLNEKKNIFKKFSMQIPQNTPNFLQKKPVLGNFYVTIIHKLKHCSRFIYNNKANQLNLSIIIKLFWDEEFMENDVLKQFVQDSQIHIDYELKFNHSSSHLINYKSQILKISNKQFIYKGYQRIISHMESESNILDQKNWKLIV
ncbi:unnamed protein product (macronuclear) [Paramecium tetraurelia]|uniref:Uncharacterized protein n=1 Tax=Paramecium tetraurelia TaxID=5888 RepID=A0DR52_PARTE|nr:uncharacterized protein GSPATT00002920001 [Paramecium tetraurelia]CAK85519.1 unnamed protein product [Paramecium tetraurelia]|eukprot:XP_001452916.1 hypothetical protein (macronuclear) [Paramecium tetraurelia strain d4-2]